METAETAVRRTSALRIGSRMTKPESQNTGIETTQPMSCTAMTGLSLPTRWIIISASFKAPPVFSSTVPIIAPRMMTMPMLVNVPENPCPMTVARPYCIVPSASLWSMSGMPATSPSASATNMIEINGWMRSFEIMTIIMTIATQKARISGNPVISKPPCIGHNHPFCAQTKETSLHAYFNPIQKNKQAGTRKKRAQNSAPASISLCTMP